MSDKNYNRIKYSTCGEESSKQVPCREIGQRPSNHLQMGDKLCTTSIRNSHPDSPMFGC